MLWKRLPHILLPYMLKLDEFVHEAIVAASHRKDERRTKKSIETRKRIMSVATKIMVERGSTDFKMSEVSSQAQLSKGALYYYFADKDSLVQAVFDSSVDDLAEEVTRVSTGTSVSIGFFAGNS